MDTSEPETQSTPPSSSGDEIRPSGVKDLPVESGGGTPSAAAFVLVRLAEIVGQTVRWIFFCGTGLGALWIVGYRWNEMNRDLQHWWQSPLIAMLLLAGVACIFMITLSIMMISNGKRSNRLSKDDLILLTTSKNKHLTEST